MQFKQSTSFLPLETVTALEKMKMMVPLFILASLLATCHGADSQTFPLRMRTGGLEKRYPTEVYCNSWRFAVEAHNLREFETVTKACREYIADYIRSDQYQSDSKQVCIQANYHTADREIDTDRDIFIFGVDDTVLSSVPYQAQHGYGSTPFNSTAWHEWVAKGVAPALPESLKLYGILLSRGINIVFLTTRRDKYRAITASNLKKAGFHTWEKLITKGDGYSGKTQQEYKIAERQKLEEEGYRIIGSIGDQWSDLVGDAAGERWFRLPNPMYYVI